MKIKKKGGKENYKMCVLGRVCNPRARGFYRGCQIMTVRLFGITRPEAYSRYVFYIPY